MEITRAEQHIDYLKHLLTWVDKVEPKSFTDEANLAYIKGSLDGAISILELVSEKD